MTEPAAKSRSSRATRSNSGLKPGQPGTGIIKATRDRRTLTGQRDADWVRPPRRARREGPVRHFVEEDVHLRVPADDLVQMREHPDVGEAIEIRETAAVGLEDLDRRRAAVVGHRLEWHAVEIDVRRGNAPDRSVDDRLDPPLVERGLNEGQRCAAVREAPEGERAVESLRSRDRPFERALRREQGNCLRVEDRRRVEIRPCVEEELQHQLGAEVAHVLDRRPAPARERVSTAPRGAEGRPRRPGIARARAAHLDQAGVAELGQPAVDERAGAREHAADLAARR